ncbi:hypothetical protein DFP73DRAFT_533375 [Morchella snyderi]|nr:hypothetical protein DFP73DRAFT_533375 [Morchella snyderi]
MFSFLFFSLWGGGFVDLVVYTLLAYLLTTCWRFFLYIISYHILVFVFVAVVRSLMGSCVAVQLAS